MRVLHSSYHLDRQQEQHTIDRAAPTHKATAQASTMAAIAGL